jgi:ATP phosphoribosyltransferase regulatory subunit
LPTLNGGVEILNKAAEIAPTQESKKAIIRLFKMNSLLTAYGVDSQIKYDLSISGKYGYYSGMVFRIYTHETGEAIVRGGRYDHLLNFFGKDNPSVGFAIILDSLLNSLLRQNIDVRTRETSIIIYNESTFSKALGMAMGFRNKGKSIELIKQDSRNIEEMVDYGLRKGVSSIFLYLEPKQAKMINLITGEEQEIVM